jgi:hypothetical protein
MGRLLTSSARRHPRRLKVVDRDASGARARAGPRQDAKASRFWIEAAERQWLGRQSLSIANEIVRFFGSTSFVRFFCFLSISFPRAAERI